MRRTMQLSDSRGCQPGAADSNRSSPIDAAVASVRRSLWGIGGISMVINLLMLTGPMFMLQVYDRVLVSDSVPTLVAIGAIALVLYGFYGLLVGLRGRVLLRVGQQIGARLSREAFALSATAPSRLGPGGGRLRPDQDLDTVSRFMSGSGPAAIFDLPWLPLYLGLLFLFHAALGFLALGGAVVIGILASLNEVSSRKPVASSVQARMQRGSFAEDSRRNAEAVRAMGMVNALAEHWHRANLSFLAGQRRAADRAGAYQTAIRTIRLVLQSAILAVGAWLAIRQEISPGAIIACSIMTSRALAPVEQSVGQWRGFIAARQSFLRLREMLRTPVEPGRGVTLPLPERRLEIEQLYCCPVGAGQPIVHDVAFGLRAGEGLCILGPSGSGKSTLVKAVVGIACVLKGSVRFDGAEPEQWSSACRSRFIGYLPQELQLFDGTVGQNIARFDPQASSAEIIDAAQLTDVHAFVTRLPDGYDTVIGTEGMVLSGGQRQRIALARALFRRPFLLALDEPNAHLDSEGEDALSRAIAAMRAQGSIVVLVAHRPRAIAAVDKVLCLRDGRVADYGARDDVMRKLVAPVASRRVA
jgi:PrtD family type I secretion system ABC transporter